MALSIGELAGYLDLDAGPFDKAIGSAFDMMGSKKWQVVGAAAGVAAGTALAAGLLSAVDTEKATNKLNAQLGLTGDDAARAGAVAGNLYADNYGESMEDVTGAVGAVMSSISGMRTAGEADVQAMTAKVMDLASAFDIDVGRAAQVAGQMITSGLAKDGAEAADLLTVALQKVPQNVREDILDATDEYGPFFQQLGIGGETAMQMLVKSSEKGMYGIDKTGDALKEFTIRSTDMSKATGTAYDALGMNQEEMTNKLLAGGDTASQAFAQIITGIQDIKDPAEQSQAALALFGTPLEDLGTSEIPKFIDSLANMGSEGFGNVAGAAEKMGDTLNGGAGGALKTFQRTAESTLGKLGESILPVLTPILEKLSEWAPVLGPVVIALGAFAAIMWVVNAAMLASPLTWIVLGIVALIAAIVLLVMNWETVANWISVVWGGFINWCIEIIDGFVVWWNQIWGGFANWITELWNGFIGMITDAWNAYITWIITTVTGFVTWWNGIWAAVGQFISDAWNGFIGFIMGVWNGYWAWVMGVVSAFSSWWGGIWDTVKQFIIDAWNNIVTGVSDGVNNVIKFVQELPDKILGFFSNAGTLLLDAGKNILQGFLDGLTSGFNAVKDFVGGIGDWIAKNKGPKAYDLALLVPAGGWIMDGLQTGIKKSMPSLKKTLGGVSATIAGGVDGGTVGLDGAMVPTASQQAAAAPGQAPQNIFNVSVEGGNNPEETWQLFKNRLNESFRGQGSEVVIQ